MSSKNLSTVEQAGLKPELVWRIFAGLADTPRPSKHEERVRHHLREFVEQKGFKVNEDAAGNQVIEVPASVSCASAPITVLQAHVDMVCEKNGDVQHDFDRDPICLMLDKDAKSGERIIRARDTTLGADNGMGVSLALAAALSPEVKHGPLEILLTVDEEAGMTGAKALTPESFRGRTLLNLDSEEDDRLYVGCAGGCDSTLSWSVGASALESGGEVMRVRVQGLRGGHSGCDIHEGRGSAIKLLARALSRVNVSGLRLGPAEAGSKRNAIPREAEAIVAGGKGTKAALEQAVRQVCAEGKEESRESGLRISLDPRADSEAKWFMSDEDTQRVLAVLGALPHGVLGMSPTVPGLVQTSNNIATLSIEQSSGSALSIEMGTLSRSSSNSRLEELCRQIEAVGLLAKAETSRGNDYPGWEPNLDSPVLAACKQVYESLFKANPEVAAIHAGLECGIIGERVGKMDMVSFGPRIEGAHTPEERVFVDSVGKLWKYLSAVLETLSRSRG